MPVRVRIIPPSVGPMAFTDSEQLQTPQMGAQESSIINIENRMGERVIDGDMERGA